MTGELTSDLETPAHGDLDGGFPSVIFDEVMDTAVVLSPATTFMSAMVDSFKDELAGDMTITFGSMSSINEVPWPVIGQILIAILGLSKQIISSSQLSV